MYPCKSGNLGNTQGWAFKKHIVKRKRKFRNQNFLSLKRKCEFRNANSKRFAAQTQIPQPQIENSTAQLQIDCLRSAHKFRYLKKFLSSNFYIIEVSKVRCRRWC